jgi:glycosyltransferase involved in cell wall biosynthesis
MAPLPLNIVFFPQSVNYGLAGTNRLQNIIHYLKKENVVSLSNIALEDRSKLFDKDSNPVFIRDYREIYYGPSLAAFVGHLFSTPWHLANARRNKHRNVLYFYGEVDLKNFFFVIWAKLIGYKVVIDIVEDLDAHTKFRSFKNKLKYKSAVFFRKRLDLFASGFTAVSTHLYDKFSRKFPRVPLFLLPVTVNQALLTGIIKNRSSSLLTLFYSGSFNEKDGLPYLLEGIYLAREEGIDLKLLVSGKGTAKEMAHFREVAGKFGLGDVVDYRGFLNRDDYVELLVKQVDVCCMTRINSAYANAGFPFKLGEFLATGKPVIASVVGDVGKYLTAEDAYLVVPEKPLEIKNAIVDIFHNPARAHQVGANGRKVAGDHFDHQRYALPLKDFLAEKLWVKN